MQQEHTVPSELAAVQEIVHHRQTQNAVQSSTAEILGAATGPQTLL